MNGATARHHGSRPMSTHLSNLRAPGRPPENCRNQATGRTNGLDAPTYGPNSSRKGAACPPRQDLPRRRVPSRPFFHPSQQSSGQGSIRRCCHGWRGCGTRTVPAGSIAPPDVRSGHRASDRRRNRRPSGRPELRPRLVWPTSALSRVGKSRVSSRSPYKVPIAHEMSARAASQSVGLELSVEVKELHLMNGNFLIGGRVGEYRTSGWRGLSRKYGCPDCLDGRRHPTHDDAGAPGR